jgi:hypothetical protein
MGKIGERKDLNGKGMFSEYYLLLQADHLVVKKPCS